MEPTTQEMLMGYYDVDKRQNSLANPFGDHNAIIPDNSWQQEEYCVQNINPCCDAALDGVMADIVNGRLVDWFHGIEEDGLLMLLGTSVRFAMKRLLSALIMNIRFGIVWIASV